MTVLFLHFLSDLELLKSLWILLKTKISFSVIDMTLVILKISRSELLKHLFRLLFIPLHMFQCSYVVQSHYIFRIYLQNLFILISCLLEIVEALKGQTCVVEQCNSVWVIHQTLLVTLQGFTKVLFTEKHVAFFFQTGSQPTLSCLDDWFFI